ncbi:hypothetical protein AVEN_84121-1 [Araneus ventricosus]|uniref:Uncharacterized protein n=1 Tax=Araneus ventricosus TaxID=182803 RepID=A0A4Y2VZ65_ARAVE|nr:hypothetical protein AVEN_84121-1 [Araneus ventricosus]
MHPSASLCDSRENAPIEFPKSGEKSAVWPPLLLQHVVYNSDVFDLQVATARTRSCGRTLRLETFWLSQSGQKLCSYEELPGVTADCGPYEKLI